MIAPKFRTILSTFMFCLCFSAISQVPNPVKGYIIEIDGTSVFLDYGAGEVKVGERLQAMSEPKIMTHPVTKERIVKEGELIATLEITETQKNYSIAGRVFPANAIAKLKIGTRVQRVTNANTTNKQQIDGKVNVVIADATVNDVVGIGYFGNYVSDLLMQEMLDCEKIRLIDRSVLNAQIDETNLANDGIINTKNSILAGQVAGVQYMIQVTMQRPDVTNITTGIPLKSFMAAAGALSGAVGGSQNLTNSLNTSASLSSNIQKSQLKASVNLTARVVDLQTGEILFICSGTGNAQGESQLALEEGALGGLQINSGVEGFKQTVTGKAIALGFRKIGGNLKSYFNGETTEKVMKSGFLDNKMEIRKGAIYMGVNRLSQSEIKELMSDAPQLYFDYKKAKNTKRWGNGIIIIGLSGIATTSILAHTDVSGWEPGIWAFKNRRDEDIKFNSRFFDWVFPSFFLTGAIGWYLHQHGNMKIRQHVNTYNSRFDKPGDISTLGIGVKNGGLSLVVNF